MTKSLTLALIGLLVLSAQPISADVISPSVTQSSDSLTSGADITQEPSISSTKTTSSTSIVQDKISEPTTSDTSVLSEADSENTTTTMVQSEIESGAITIVDGVATVYDETDFWSAIANQSVSKIILGQNIIANPANRTTESGSSVGEIKRNLIIDGDSYNLSYDATNYTSTILLAGASGIEVTFQNMSMGSLTYPNNSYYGIFRIDETNVTLNVKDFTYYAERGAQPFYADANQGVTLNLYGTNKFTAVGPTSGGEFIERFPTVNFKADSSTSVEQDNPGSDGVIWSASNSTIVNLEQNAQLQVKSSRYAFIYGNATINLQENAHLTYENKLGTNYTNTSAKFGSGTTTVNSDVNSEITLLSNEYSMDLSGTTINANAMRSIYVLNNLNNAASSNTLTLKRTDVLVNAYDIHALSSDGVQSRPVSNILANTSTSISPTTYGSKKSFLYIAEPTVSSLFESQVGSNLSNLNGSIDAESESIRTVKWATSPLYSGDNINSTESQAAIEAASSSSITLDSNEPVILESNVLGEQSYYIYYNAQYGVQYEGYTLTSKWDEAIVVQTPYIELTFPDSGLFFNQPIAGTFSMTPNYRVKNSGNVPVNIKPTGLTDLNTNVTLVESTFEPNKQQVSLFLKGTSKTESHDWNLKNLDETTLTLNPYFTDSNYIDYSIHGNYSGPLIGIQAVTYNMAFNWSQ